MAKRGWLRKATARMKRKGTVGAFGRATASKIKKGLRSRSLKQVRRAAFAKAMKTIARRKRARRARRR